MKEVLQKLVSQEEIERARLTEIMVEITHEKYSNEQIAALLMGLQTRGITVEELLGLRDGLMQTGLPVDLGTHDVVDIVGTGGDGKNTFNISTCACFVVAGAGYKVAKHGNYAATSVSGASNVIEGHGVKFTNDEARLRCSLEECGMAYLHAPLFARGMKFVAPVRKALGIPTAFNLLGPLVNPARPKFNCLGVATLAQMRLYSSVLDRMGVGYCIVNSLDGYDEISLTSDFKIKTPVNEQILAPRDLALPTVRPEEIFGGSTKEEAMAIFDNVLAGRATVSQMQVVLVNAAAAIQAVTSKPFTECLQEATESLFMGKAYEALQAFIELNRE